MLILQKTVAKVLPSPPMVTALDLHHNHLSDASKMHRLSLGCQVLDRFLCGGILSQGITEISGESASGKTQLCLQLCLAVQLPISHGGLAGGELFLRCSHTKPNFHAT